MIYVPDTNVLLRFAVRSDPQHPTVLAAIKNLKLNDDQIQILPQTCVEFWNVLTRPTSGKGFGLSVEYANRSLQFVENIFPLLADTPRIFDIWRTLVVDFGVSGVKVHDAKIVAAMLAHDCTQILTYNPKDFARYSSTGIIAVDPSDVQSPNSPSD